MDCCRPKVILKRVFRMAAGTRTLMGSSTVLRTKARSLVAVNLEDCIALHQLKLFRKKIWIERRRENSKQITIRQQEQQKKRVRKASAKNVEVFL